MPELTIAERVAAGAKWLDDRKPDWWIGVDVAGFDIDSCHLCALGQTYGNYWDSPLFADMNLTDEYFILNADEDREAIARAEPLGFYADSEVAGLNAEWERVIRARREQVSHA